MLKLFNRNTGFQIIVILVVTILLWLRPLANPQPMPEVDGFAPLYNILQSLSLAPLISVMLAMVLVVLGSLGLNLMLANAGLVSQNSLLPALLYILFMSAGADTLSPTLIASLLSIAFVSMLLLHGTLLTISSEKIFGATALIGISSMFFLPSLVLLASYLLVAVSYRLYNWRDWMVLLLGLLAPYTLLWIILFMGGGLGESFNQLGDTLTHPHIFFQADEWSLSLVANGVLLLVFAVSLFVILIRMNERTTVWKKNASAVLLTTVAGIGMLAYTAFFPVNLQFFAIPFALCATLRFTTESHSAGYSRRRRSDWKKHLKDILFIIIIVAAIVC